MMEPLKYQLQLFRPTEKKLEAYYICHKIVDKANRIRNQENYFIISMDNSVCKLYNLTRKRKGYIFHIVNHFVFLCKLLTVFVFF